VTENGKEKFKLKAGDLIQIKCDTDQELIGRIQFINIKKKMAHVQQFW
jgi:hypothetical protein